MLGDQTVKEETSPSGTATRYHAHHFTGGTPRYQCESVSYSSNPQLFDRIGLVLSLLEKLGKIELIDQMPVKLDTLKGAIARMTDEDMEGLQNKLRKWINL